MPAYLLIESRDPFEDRSVDEDYDLARDLAASGSEVAVFLVQNGVLPARRGAEVDGLADLVARGVHVTADAFSLRERAIPADKLLQGVSAGELEPVLDALEGGRNVIWL